jgi:hypothetical protein
MLPFDFVPNPAENLLHVLGMTSDDTVSISGAVTVAGDITVWTQCSRK